MVRFYQHCRFQVKSEELSSLHQAQETSGKQAGALLDEVNEAKAEIEKLKSNEKRVVDEKTLLEVSGNHC